MGIDKAVTRFLNRFKGQVEIREADESDADCLIAMAQARCADEHQEMSDDAPERLMKWLHLLLASPCGLIYIAEVSGEVAGMIVCISDSDPWNSKPYLSISMIYVKPKHRTKPVVAMSLIRACKLVGEGAGIREFRTNTSVSDDTGHPRLFEKVIGMKPTSVRMSYIIELEGENHVGSRYSINRGGRRSYFRQ